MNTNEKAIPSARPTAKSSPVYAQNLLHNQVGNPSPGIPEIGSQLNAKVL
jgi:hypothetical protein